MLPCPLFRLECARCYLSQSWVSTCLNSSLPRVNSTESISQSTGSQHTVDNHKLVKHLGLLQSISIIPNNLFYLLLGTYDILGRRVSRWCSECSRLSTKPKFTYTRRKDIGDTSCSLVMFTVHRITFWNIERPLSNWAVRRRKPGLSSIVISLFRLLLFTRSILSVDRCHSYPLPRVKTTRVHQQTQVNSSHL